jgi:hypothetical protein
MKRRPGGRAHQAVGPQGGGAPGTPAARQGAPRPSRRTPTSSGTCSGPTRSRRASWRRSSGRGTPRRAAPAPRSPASSAAGDGGGCGVAALGAAGRPSDLERQGGHAGGVGDLGKVGLCVVQHVTVVVVFFLAVVREGQRPAINFQRSKIGEVKETMRWRGGTHELGMRIRKLLKRVVFYG